MPVDLRIPATLLLSLSAIVAQAADVTYIKAGSLFDSRSGKVLANRIIGNNPPIDREQVREVVSQGNFDAVLVTRVDDRAYSVREQQGAVDAQATTKGGNVFNFFRYDYVELNEPTSLDLTGSVVLTTELYVAADKRKAWAVETTARDMANMSDLVEASASAVVKRMQRDGLIAR